MVQHLGAFSLTQVTAQAIFDGLCKLFTELRLPWENLVTVLMDSCAVMRGSKKGLEILIRTRKAPQLLDIDGDSIHHVYNAAKAFCKPFGNIVESLMQDIHTDFKWSSDLKSRLGEICVILGLKPTAPERYVPHRWLSVLDVAFDTLRLFDAYTLFYYSFLPADDMSVYLDVMKEVLERCSVSAEGKQNIIEMQRSLRQKFSSFTKEGRPQGAHHSESVHMQNKN